MDKTRLAQLPEYLKADIIKTEELRNIHQKTPGEFTLLHLEIQFDQLVTSLKCSRIERVITRMEEEDIRNEYSTY